MRPPEQAAEGRGGGLAGHAALVGVQLCFGLFPVFGVFAFAEGGFQPFGVATWRLAAGALALGPIAYGLYGRRAIPKRADLARLFACGVLGVGLNQAFFLEGLSRSTPMNAALVMCLIPVFTFVIASCVGLERFEPVRALGVLIALLGTLPLFLGEGAQLLGPYGPGNLLMTGNALVYAAYLVISKPLVERYPPLVVIFWAYTFALCMVPYFVWSAPLLPADLNLASAWVALAYIIVFPTILGYLLNGFALSRVRASTTATYIYMQPLVAGVASYLVLGETLTRGTLRASVALFVGIWLVTRRPVRRAAALGESVTSEPPTL